MASTRRKSAAIALAVVGIAGLSLASAATLTVEAGTIQAGTVDQANCQGAVAVAVDFDSAWDATAGEFLVNNVDLSAINAACATSDVQFTLLDATGAALFTSVDAAAADGAFAVSPAVPAADVTGVAVVIH